MRMTIKKAALTLLSRQPYTVYRMGEKLKQKGFSAEETEECLEWCVRAGYLNDSAWAERAAELKAAKGWDNYKIAAYLYHYGISRENITNAIDALKADYYE